MHWESEFRELALRQAGAIGIDQIRSLGRTGTHWGRARGNGRWQVASRRVLVLHGTPPTTSQRAHAALLDAGGDAVLHGPSALAWLGMANFGLSQILVARCRGVRNDPAELAVVHRLRDLRACDVTTVRGIRTETALRAIWTEASRYANERWYDVGVDRVERLADDANRLGLLTWAQLHASVEDLQQRGRAGTVVMREVARRRPPGTALTESRLEDRFESVIAGTGLPTMSRQRDVGGVAPIGRVDHRDPDLPAVIETNSIAFHSLPSDQTDDEERYAALVAAGFCVAVVWEPDLWSHPRNVVAVVRDVRQRARVGEPAVVHTASCPWPHDPTRTVIPEWKPPTRG